MTLTRFTGGAWQLRLITLLSMVAMLAIVASACGDDDDDDDDADVATEEEETATEEAADDDTGEATAGVEIRIPAGEPIIIGASVPLTGPDAGLGIDSRDGAIVGIEQWKADNEDQILGHDIELVAEDDGCSDAAIATAAAERLVDQAGLVALVGPLCSGGAQAAIPIYQEAGFVMISGSATRTDLAETQPQPVFFFRAVFRNADEGVVQARYAIDVEGATTAYVVDDTEPYGEDLADAAQEALEAENVTVTREKIERGTTDFSALASRAAADNPDVFIFEGFNPEGQLILAALRAAGYEGLFMSGDGVASVADFITPDPELAEGAYFAGCGGDYPEEILTLYDEFIGNEPSTPFVAHYADASRILLTAIAEVAVDEGGELVINTGELRDAVAAIEFDGFTGPITFAETGDRAGAVGEELGLPECLVEDGAFVTL
ncbi:MAG TPA: branched-chain amino acid ABC transporter substrate-binding protein [Dehalococcoidia bacterium]|nr:branched-chain amino acid ABC transporter substrate-binding protein [Dehalococcoidia bacterium]